MFRIMTLSSPEHLYYFSIAQVQKDNIILMGEESNLISYRDLSSWHYLNALKHLIKIKGSAITTKSHLIENNKTHHVPAQCVEKSQLGKGSGNKF